MNVAFYPITTVSLFSGFGSLDIGVELAVRHLGRSTQPLVYVENEITAAVVLASRIEEGSLAPGAIWSDVRTFDGSSLSGKVDLVYGGFPCPDISHAGKRAGLEGTRSGLWVQFARIIRQARPRFVFIENVRGMLNPIRDDDGRVVAEPPLRTVLGDLADLGFDAEWAVVSAEDCGLPQGRDRVFILAYANGNGRTSRGSSFAAAGHWRAAGPAGSLMGDPEGIGRQEGTESARQQGRYATAEFDSAVALADRESDDGPGESGARRWAEHPDGRESLGNADRPGLEGRIERERGLRDEWATRAAGYPLFPRGPGLGGAGVVDRLRDLFRRKPDTAWSRYQAELGNTLWWAECLGRFPELAPALDAEIEPDLRRLADGLADLVGGSRTDALRGTGNGVVAVAAAASFVSLARRAGVRL